ncbi:MAG: DNA polymerase III subunit delta [Clostridia bacterium]|nr:DNA polymerase III subunit delta [Clostridia bacterium]
MDLKALNQAITKKEFSNLYFFYGEEDYLKEFYVNRILHTVVEDAFSCFNLFQYQEEPDKNELINALSQPPVMAEYKVVYLNQLDLSKCNSPFRETLLEQMEKLAEFVILIIRETQVDKRSKIWTTAQKKGETIECKYPSPADMRAFINREFSKRNKQIPPHLVDKIIEENEQSLHSVMRLIETVCAYLQDTPAVTEQSLDEFMQKSTQTVVFDLSEALVNRKKEDAYNLLNKLKLNQTKNPPQVLFSLLARHISGLYLSTAGQKERLPLEDIKKMLGKNIPDFVVRKYVNQARNLPLQKLEELVLFCAETDYKLKTGQIADPYLGIYTLFLKFWEA